MAWRRTTRAPLAFATRAAWATARSEAGEKSTGTRMTRGRFAGVAMEGKRAREA